MKFTIFEPHLSHSSLLRDLGYMTQCFTEDLNYDCSLLCYWTYDEVINYCHTHHLSIHFMENVVTTLTTTDVLLVIGLYDNNVQLIKHYHQLNPKGKVYFKLDLNRYWLEHFILTPEWSQVLTSCQLISVESLKLQQFILEHWSVPVRYIPNGYYANTYSPVAYENKENIILAIGHFSKFHTATHLLIQAFTEICSNLPGWKLQLLGTFDSELTDFITQHLTQYGSLLRNRILFSNQPLDFAIIKNSLKNAKLFCSTSYWDGCLSLFSEAAAQGCYILSSDLYHVYDATDNLKYGGVFEPGNLTALSQLIKETCLNEALLQSTCEGIQQYAFHSLNYFYWGQVIDDYLNLPSVTSCITHHVIDRLLIEKEVTSILEIAPLPHLAQLLKISPYHFTHYSLNLENLDCSFLTKDYDIIFVSNSLEYFSKKDGYVLLDTLLAHTRLKLIIVTPMSSQSTILTSRWSYIDFAKYDFSGRTLTLHDQSFSIFSLYPYKPTPAPIDVAYTCMKQQEHLQIDSTQPLNIAFLVSGNGITGGFKILIKYIQGLKKLGHHIIALIQNDEATSFFPPSYPTIVDEEIVIKTSDSPIPYLTSCDVILCGFVELPQVKDTDLPVILFDQGHQIIFGETWASNAYLEKTYKLYYDHLFRNSDKLIFSVSPILSNIFYNKYSRYTTIIPNGIDLDLYHPSFHSAQDITLATKLLLVGCPYISFKGFDIAIKVIEKLYALGYALTITWISPIPIYLPLSFKANFIIDPDEPSLGSVLREQDILLSTSWYESFSLPPLEAMASGVAVVCTQNGGITTYGQNGDNCLLAEPGDIESLCHHIQALIDNPLYRAQLITNGLKTAQHFTLDHMVNTLEKALYEASAFYKQNNYPK